MAPKYITGEELAAIIKDPSKKRWADYLVVDVRDDDYEGGNIVGALNIPSQKFHLHVDNLIHQAHEKDVKLVVFHCSLSQQRGPKAARIYEEVRSNIHPVVRDEEIAILRDGFSSFQAKYRADPALIENWDKDFWDDSYH